MFLRRAAGAVFGSIVKTGERQYSSSAMKDQSLLTPNVLKQQKSMIECCMSGCRNCPFGFAAAETISSVKNCI